MPSHTLPQVMFFNCWYGGDHDLKYRSALLEILEQMAMRRKGCIFSGMGRVLRGR